MKWTRNIPTQEGAYWCRHTDIKVDVRLCLIVNRNGEWRVCAQRKDEYGTPLALFMPKYFEWVGPLENPED